MSKAPLRWKNLPAAALAHDATLRAEWDRLNAERGDLSFLSAYATTAALSAFGEGNERLLIASEGERPAAMLVLTPIDRFRWRTFQPSQMPLGVWVAAKVFTPGQLGESLLGSGALPFCLIFSFTQIDSLLTPPTPDSGRSHSDAYIDTPWLDIAGSFEDYWAARGKNLRQNLRKQRNKLAAEGTVATLRLLDQAQDIAPALARYGSLESAGWKAGQGTAIHPDNAQGRFYLQLLEQAAQRGEARVYEYLFGDRVVAINLCLLRAGMLVVLKTTYDESIPKALSPAFLLREEELQHIFGGQEIRRIEYYGRVMEWHTRLTEQSRPIYHLTCYRWAWLKKLAQRRRQTAHNEQAGPPAAEHPAQETAEA